MLQFDHSVFKHLKRSLSLNNIIPHTVTNSIPLFLPFHLVIIIPEESMYHGNESSYKIP